MEPELLTFELDPFQRIISVQYINNLCEENGYVHQVCQGGNFSKDRKSEWSFQVLKKIGMSKTQHSVFGPSRHAFARSIFKYSRIIFWRRKRQPIPAFLPRECRGQRSLVGCLPQGRTKSDTTEATQQQQNHFFPEKEGFFSDALVAIYLEIKAHKRGIVSFTFLYPCLAKDMSCISQTENIFSNVYCDHVKENASFSTHIAR